MHWIALSCVLATACLASDEVSGRWNIGGPGGCQADHAIYVELSDGGQHTSEYFACGGGRFSIAPPTSAEHRWLSLSDTAGDALFGTAHRELTGVADDVDVGLILFEPIDPSR
jgi:hypothetical protein